MCEALVDGSEKWVGEIFRCVVLVLVPVWYILGLSIRVGAEKVMLVLVADTR